MSRRELLRALALLSLAIPVRAGGLTENVGVVGTWDGRSAYAEVVGHTTGGVDLALVGTASGAAFVNVTAPSAPVEVGFVSAAPGAHSVAAFENVAYVVSEGGGGLVVVSLASPTNPAVHATDTSVFDQATALCVDTIDEVLYVAGTESGLVGFDISTPLSPVSIYEALDTFPVVSLRARRPAAYAATGTSLAILNVALPPVLELRSWVTHSDASVTDVELSEDLKRVMLADARPGGGEVRIYDVTNPARVAYLGSVSHTTAPGAEALAVSWSGTLAYVAWGIDGLEVLDTTDDVRPVRVGAYASPAPDAAGIVDVYARNATGLSYALDGEDGLAVLEHIAPFGTVTGLVIDAMTSGPAPNVAVTAAGVETRATRTKADGTYTLALAPGTYDLTFDEFRYVAEVDAVEVTEGAATVQDVTLQRLPVGTLRGTVSLAMREGARGAREARHPEGTIVRIFGTPIVFPAGFTGFYFIPGIPTGTYIAEADRFGHDAQQFEVTVSEGQETFQDFLLPLASFADNFSTDLGWTAGAPGDDATSGAWSRVIPIGTGAGYIQPALDETPDPDSTAFVTGNGPSGGWIFEDDVDGGTTTVLSPLFDLTAVEAPLFRYYRWFANDASWAGETYDGDAFTLDVSNDGGDTWTNVETLTTSLRFWPEATFVLSRYVTITDEMQMRVQVTDGGAPSIVEAAFDDVEVWSGAGLVQLPPVPIDVGSVSVVSTAPGRVTLRWAATGRYDRFDIERATSGEPRVVGSTTEPFAPERYTFTDRTAPAGQVVRYWITGVREGIGERRGPFAVRVEDAVDRARLLAPLPNPTDGAVTLRYELEGASGDAGAVAVKLRLFDASGRWLVTLVEGAQPPGRYAIVWDGRDARGRSLPSGVYWFALETPSARASGQVIRVR